MTDDEKCYLCGNLKEDVFHVMFECVHYSIYRTTFLVSLKTKYNRDNYYECFKNINHDNMKNMFIAVQNILQARNVYYELIESVGL